MQNHDGLVTFTNVLEKNRINRPGGQGLVTHVHRDEVTHQVGKVDVKYVLGGFDKNVPIHFVEAPEHGPQALSTGRRRTQRTTTSKDDQVKSVLPDPHIIKKRPRCSTAKSEGNAGNENIENSPNKANAKRLRTDDIRGKAVQVKRSDEEFFIKQVDAKKSGKPPAIAVSNKPKLQRRTKTASGVAGTTPNVPKTIIVRASFTSPCLSINSSPVGGVAIDRTPQRFMVSEIERVQPEDDESSPLLVQGCEDDHEAKTNSCSLLSASRMIHPNKPTSTGAMGEEPDTNDQKPRAGAKDCFGETEEFVANKETSENSSLIHKNSASSIVQQHGGGSNGNPGPTLGSEHLRSMKSAAKFIQEIVDGEKNLTNDIEETKGKLPTTAGCPTLMAEFFRALHELLEQNDSEFLEEDTLVDDINQFSKRDKNFTSGEVQELLDHLSQENKIMRSDGQIFVI